MDMYGGSSSSSSTDAVRQQAMQLRVQARQDSTLPEQIVVNNDLALLAQRIAGERRMYSVQPVENLFSQYRAMQLKRYGLKAALWTLPPCYLRLTGR